jgi:hypothetical protein
MLASWSYEGVVFLDLLSSSHSITSSLFPYPGLTDAPCSRLGDPVPPFPRWRPHSQGPRTLPYRDPEQGELTGRSVTLAGKAYRQAENIRKKNINFFAGHKGKQNTGKTGTDRQEAGSARTTGSGAGGIYTYWHAGHKGMLSLHLLKPYSSKAVWRYVKVYVTQASRRQAGRREARHHQA